MKPCLLGNSRQSRAVWIRANGPVPKGIQVLHRCDSPLCREITHLFLGTQSENILDAVMKGRWTHASHNKNRAKGAKHPKAKLTEQDVIAIRKEHKESRTPQTRIAARYGVSYATINFIISGRNWRHVPSN